VIAAGVHQQQQSAIEAVTTQFAHYAAIAPVTATKSYDAGAMPQVARPQATIPNGPQVTLTSNTDWKAPSSNLFNLHAKDGAGYLVETDPLFTNKQQWLGSDYFLRQLNLDPERTLKRYGDGFAEQRAITDQLVNITGRNTLSGYQNTQQAYQALMDAGVAYAKEFQLSPGIALSDQQMALLTTDIVWLQEETVKLPDGSTTKALVPQVYLRRPQTGDIDTSGALISGNNVIVRNKNGDINNSGTILAGYANAKAGDQQGIIQLDAINITNKGTVAGNLIDINATKNINNLGGKIIGLSNNANSNDSQVQLTAKDISIASTTASAANQVSNVTNISRVANTRPKIAASNSVRNLDKSEPCRDWKRCMLGYC
jgi:filamentous hemagglutinin